MTTLYDTGNSTNAGRRIGQKLGMRALTPNDVKKYCLQHKFAHKCGLGTRFDEDHFACVARSAVCPEGYVMNATKKCVEADVRTSHANSIKCGPGTVLDPEKNYCRVECDVDASWNEGTRQCERQCPDGAVEHTVCGPRDKEILSCAFK